MLTYSLFKTQIMLLSATSRKGQLDANLQAIQSPMHAFISNKQDGPARCWLTRCSTPKACFCQWQAAWASQMLTYSLSKTQSMLLSVTIGRDSQMLTYSLFRTQSMLLSATIRKGQPQSDADLHSVHNPKDALISNKQKGPARSWLTFCSKPRACSYQLQAERTSQMLTYPLVKTQNMLLSATSRKEPPEGDLLTVQNTEHALVKNK